MALPLTVALALQARWAIPLYLLGVAPSAIVTGVYYLGGAPHYAGISLRDGFTHPFWMACGDC